MFQMKNSFQYLKLREQINHNHRACSWMQLHSCYWLALFLLPTLSCGFFILHVFRWLIISLIFFLNQKCQRHRLNCWSSVQSHSSQFNSLGRCLGLSKRKRQSISWKVCQKINSLQLHLKLFYKGRVGLDEHSKLLNYELSFSIT